MNQKIPDQLRRYYDSHYSELSDYDAAPMLESPRSVLIPYKTAVISDQPLEIHLIEREWIDMR